MILFADSEIGAVILSDMVVMEYISGNLQQAERYFNFAKDLCKKLSHAGTIKMLLACVVWDYKTSSLEIAEKISQIVHKEPLWGSLANIIVGHALIASGRHQEGLQTVEAGVSATMAKFGNSIDVCLATPLLEAYIATHSIEKGVGVANHILKKSNEFNLESCLGKAELLRQKATLLMLKKFPDFVPESSMQRVTDSSIADLIAFGEQLNNNQNVMLGPQPLPVLNSFAHVPTTSTESANEDIELLLRSAINLAHTRGLCLVELNCAIDLVKYFVHCGDKTQAQETVQIVKDACSKIKGDPLCKEFQRAQQVVALVAEA